jgi:hypothetical protein
LLPLYAGQYWNNRARVKKKYEDKCYNRACVTPFGNAK